MIITEDGRKKNEALQIDKKKTIKKQDAVVTLKLKLNFICCYELLLCDLFILIDRQLTQYSTLDTKHYNRLKVIYNLTII